LTKGEAGHGIGVGYPGYHTTDFSVCIPEGSRNFGFWPKSKNIFIGASQKTWFFDEKGRFQSWFAGYRLTDARNGKDMLFGNADGRVIPKKFRHS